MWNSHAFCIIYINVYIKLHINWDLFWFCSLTVYSDQVSTCRKNGLCHSLIALPVLFQNKLEAFNTSRLQEQPQLQKLLLKAVKRKPLSSVSVTAGYFFTQNSEIVHMNESCQSPEAWAYCLCSCCTQCSTQLSALLLQQSGFVTVHEGEYSWQSQGNVLKEEHMFSSAFGSCD